MSAYTEDCGTPISTFPFEEGFEGASFPGKCWRIYDLDGAGATWAKGSTANSGTGSALHTYASGEQEGWLVTPQIAIGAGNFGLSFFSYNQYPGDYGNNSVWVSTGSGDPGDGDFVELWAADAVEAAWVETEISLAAYSGQDIYIAFKYEGDFAHGWYLDDVKVTELLDKDLAVTGIAPTFVMEGGTLVPKVMVTNLGTSAATGWSVTLTDGGSYSSTKTGVSIEYKEVATIVMDDWTPTAASTLTATVTYTGDQNTDNNTLSVNIDYLYYGTYAEAYTTDVYSTGTFMTLNLATGATESVGPIGSIGADEFPVGEDFDGKLIYRIFGKTVVIVMPDAAIYSLGEISGLEAAHSIVGLCYDWKESVWYLNTINVIDPNAEIYEAELFKLDMNTLVATSVGASGSDSFYRGADMADDDFIYTIDMTTSSLAKINPKTGEYTTVGATGLTHAYGQDVSFDEESKTLYTIAFNNSPQQAVFGTYDLATGAFTAILDYGLAQFATIVITNPSPNVGIEDINGSKGNGSKVYPNPSPNGQVNVSVIEKSTVRVFDFLGRLVQVKPVEANSISTMNLKSGIYLIQVEGANNKVSHKVIVK